MAGNHRRPCNVPSHPFSFGVPKEVTDVLAIGLESQESDCTRAPRTRDPIIGEATFRPQAVTEWLERPAIVYQCSSPITPNINHVVDMLIYLQQVQSHMCSIAKQHT